MSHYPNNIGITHAQWVNTVVIGDTAIDVYGTVLPAEPNVGIMNNYVEIEELAINGVSVYEMIARSNLWNEVQDAINDQVSDE